MPDRSRAGSPGLPTGFALLHDPLLNKGTAFTERERDALGLRGLLPPHVFTQADQARRILTNLRLMSDPLDKFVALDLPFLKQERQERIASLKRLMADPEANTSEKFKRILEAFQIEADYGRSLGVERAQVDGKVADVLHVGRTALFYLSIEGDSAGRWDANAGKWEPLERKYVKSVRQGMRIAREQTAADLLTLPMPTPAGAAK